MDNEIRPARLAFAGPGAVGEAVKKRFAPKIVNHPDLPVIDWALIGQAAPGLPETPGSSLPQADAIVIAWADAEWAPLQHVFCTSGQPMSYASRAKGDWPGWQKLTKGFPPSTDTQWTFWGYYRLVAVGAKKVLLFKSNTHLAYEGEAHLAQLIGILIKAVKPGLIISTGTAGGTIPSDHIGTVNVVHSGSLYKSGKPPAQWETYSNSWAAGWGLIGKAGFDKLLVPIPTTSGDMESIVSQFNAFYGTSYTGAELDINGINMGDRIPALRNMTGAGTPLLTAASFVVGTTSGSLSGFSCVEMDDAIIAKACEGTPVHFGFVRNISDPAQNEALPPGAQADWGSAIYDAYGFYTSFNGALVAWAILSA